MQDRYSDGPLTWLAAARLTLGSTGCAAADHNRDEYIRITCGSRRVAELIQERAKPAA